MVRLAKERGVDTPTHEFIYHSVLPLELRASRQARVSRMNESTRSEPAAARLSGMEYQFR